MPSYYDSLAPGYNRLHGKEQLRKISRIVKSFDSVGDDKVLDVGCGTGLSFRFFDDIVGLDPSIELLKQAEGRVVQGVAESLPFGDNSFDIVLSVSALQNFADPAEAVREMKRVCRGRFAISFVKKGSRVELLSGLLEEELDVQAVLEDEHDLIFLAVHP